MYVFIMDFADLDETMLDLKKQFNSCANCAKECNVRYKIKSCGHIYCSDCIARTDVCKCGLNYVKEKDTVVDNSGVDIFLACESIHKKLKNILRDQPAVFNAPSTTGTEQTEKSKTRETQDSNLVNVKLDDDYLQCNCFEHFEIDHTYSQPNKNELIDKKNAVGETKLHRACKKANVAEVAHLLEEGASVNAQDYAGWTPLHEAVISKNKNIIENLLKHGSVVNAPGDNYDTPLHKAVEKNDLEVVQLLIMYGADIYSRNFEGYSPWDIANSDLRYSITNMNKNIMKVPAQTLKAKHSNVYVIGEETGELRKMLKNTMNINVMDRLTSSVTMAITMETSKLVQVSYELLLVILHNIPIVTKEWVDTSVKINKIIDYSDFFIIGTEQFPCDVVYKSLLNKSKLNPKLFNGCNFYIAKTKGSYLLSNVKLTLEKIIKLLELGGGNILKREPHLTAITAGKYYPWHATVDSSSGQCCHFIIYDPLAEPELKYNMKELKHVPYEWIFECILQYKLVS